MLLVKRYGLYVNANKLILEAKKVVFVLVDKPFTILTLTSYWERWTSNGRARRTDSRAPNYQYILGWGDAA